MEDVFQINQKQGIIKAKLSLLESLLLVSQAWCYMPRIPGLGWKAKAGGA
jgi:hypothetical protein